MDYWKKLKKSRASNLYKSSSSSSEIIDPSTLLSSPKNLRSINLPKNQISHSALQNSLTVLNFAK